MSQPPLSKTPRVSQWTGTTFSPEREHRRHSMRLSAEIDTFSDRFTAVTKDLSLGGVGLELDRALKEGATIQVALFLVLDEVEDESSPPLTLRAKVVWCAEGDADGRYTAGLRFAELMPQQSAWLTRFLEVSR